MYFAIKTFIADVIDDIFTGPEELLNILRSSYHSFKQNWSKLYFFYKSADYDNIAQFALDICKGKSFNVVDFRLDINLPEILEEPQFFNFKAIDFSLEMFKTLEDNGLNVHQRIDYKSFLAYSILANKHDLSLYLINDKNLDITQAAKEIMRMSNIELTEYGTSRLEIFNDLRDKYNFDLKQLLQEALDKNQEIDADWIVYSIVDLVRLEVSVDDLFTTCPLERFVMPVGYATDEITGDFYAKYGEMLEAHHRGVDEVLPALGLVDAVD